MIDPKIEAALDKGTADYVADTVTYRDPETGLAHTSRFRLLCDFCNNELRDEDAWTYPCGYVSLRLMNPVMNYSNDDWLACSACHALIDANDWRALADRAIESQLAVIGLEPKRDEALATALDAVRRKLIEQWADFDRARTGPAYIETERRNSHD